MKKILYISIIVIMAISTCKKAPEDIIVNPNFIGKNQLWSNGVASCNHNNEIVPGWSEYLKLGKDTQINGQNWVIVLSTLDENKNGWENRVFIREINHKVYCKGLETSDPETLLYDFSVKQGDTLKFEGWHSNFIVYSVKYESLPNHQKRKHFYISTPAAPGEYVVWIDGIGSINGFFNNIGMIDYVGSVNILLCYYEDNVLVYRDTKYGFNTCYFPHK